ncbi:hypothetical protein DB347_22770 [Opitutaceae bacterium EW11]|nr:hypothetical protein DB347_22770 [Opitutaceae bacterium EW11]
MMKSTRVFQTWEFRVSHGQLLIRSPKGKSDPTNQDVIFHGVEFMEIPRYFSGLEVADATEEETRKVAMKIPDRIKKVKVFVLISANQRSLVAAAAFKQSENELDIFVTSLETFKA